MGSLASSAANHSRWRFVSVRLLGCVGLLGVHSVGAIHGVVVCLTSASCTRPLAARLAKSYALCSRHKRGVSLLMNAKGSSFVFTLLACCVAGCDPMWVRQSLIEVSPKSFPHCVEAALNRAGLAPSLRMNPDGSQYLQVRYLSGSLSVEVLSPPSNDGQVVNVRLIGRGYHPPEEVEAEVDYGVAKVTSIIATSCPRG